MLRSSIVISTLQIRQAVKDSVSNEAQRLLRAWQNDKKASLPVAVTTKGLSFFGYFLFFPRGKKKSD